MRLSELLALPMDNNPEIFDRKGWIEAEIGNASRAFAFEDLTQRQRDLVDAVGERMLDDSLVLHRVSVTADEEFAIKKFRSRSLRYELYGRDE